MANEYNFSMQAKGSKKFENGHIIKYFAEYKSKEEDKEEKKMDDKNKFTWEYAKEHLQLCIRRKGQEPTNVLKKDFLDMEMYVRVILSADANEQASYFVTPNMFFVSEEEIFASAFLSMKENEDAYDMFTRLAVEFGQTVSIGGPDMIVVSNKTGVFGASAICDTELLCSIAEKYKNNLVILPSSIHECIITPAETLDTSFSEMVRNVNENEVKPREQLSDHAYLYNRETGKITW